MVRGSALFVPPPRVPVGWAFVLVVGSGCSVTFEPYEPSNVSPDFTQMGTGGEIISEPSSLEMGEGTTEPLAPAPVSNSTLETATPVLAPALDGVLSRAAGCPGGAFKTPELLGIEEVEGSLYGPSVSRDGLTLYFAAATRTDEELFVAERADRQSVSFGTPRRLASINSGGRDGTPMLSQTGTALFFYSDRPGSAGGRDLWFATREGNVGAFSAPQAVPRINTAESELLPWLSADGSTLLYVSTRDGGQGGADLWQTRRGEIGANFQNVRNMEGLNSPANEGRAALRDDGLVAVFSSDRPGGQGGSDLYGAVRTSVDEPFSGVENLSLLNSDAWDSDVTLAADGSEVLFASTRSGSTRLWRSQRDCPAL
jgi:hypothetical protein